MDLTLPAGILLPVATIALGLALYPWLPLLLDAAERVVVGMVAAIVTVTLAGYLLALLLGLHAPVVVLLSLLTLAVSAALIRPARAQDEVRAIRRRLDGSLTVPAGRWMLTLIVLTAAAMAYLFGTSVAATPDGFLAYHNNVWSDWSFHASYTTTFVYGQNLPPQNPLFALTPFRYPFAPDFGSAMLMAGGWSLPAALIWPGWAMATLALTGVILWARRLCGSLLPGAMAVTLTLLGGGIGFWYFFSQIRQHGFGDALAHLRPITYDRQDLQGSPPAMPLDIQWYNPILSYWLPQRSFVFGAGVVMAVLLLLTPVMQASPRWQWRAALDSLRQWALPRDLLHGEAGAFLIGGTLAGVLPFFHVHSLVVLGLVTLTWAIVLPRSEWLLFAIPVLILAVPRLALAVPGDASAPASLHYPRLTPGWPGDGTNPLTFWWQNTGLFWPALLIALLSPLALPSRSRLLLAPFLLVFAVANLIIFQPWYWDNTKVLVFWYLAGGVAVGALLARMARSGFAGVLAAVLIWTSLVASGVLSLLADLPPQWIGYSWFTRDDLALAEAVRARTPPHAIFLTGDEPNNPVADLAGRSVVMSYEGWLWTYGIDYATRQRDIARIYAGDSGGLALLRRYQVHYVLIGTNEVASFHANRPYFDQHYRLVLRVGSYRLYDVTQPP